MLDDCLTTTKLYWNQPKGTVSPTIPSAPKYSSRHFIFHRKCIMFWVIRFHPSHLLFSVFRALWTWSRVPRAQRIIGFFIYYPQINKDGKSDHMESNLLLHLNLSAPTHRLPDHHRVQEPGYQEMSPGLPAQICPPRKTPLCRKIWYKIGK